MKVRELLALLNDLRVGDLEKDIYIDVGDDELVELELVPIVEDEADEEAVGYMIAAKPKEPVQLELPFDGTEDIH
jgi:hypothetical protein